MNDQTQPLKPAVSKTVLPLLKTDTRSSTRKEFIRHCTLSVGEWRPAQRGVQPSPPHPAQHRSPGPGGGSVGPSASSPGTGGCPPSSAPSIAASGALAGVGRWLCPRPAVSKPSVRGHFALASASPGTRVLRGSALSRQCLRGWGGLRGAGARGLAGTWARLSLVRGWGHAVSCSPLCFLPLGGGVRSPDGRGDTLLCSDSMAFLAWALSCWREQR